MRNRMGGDDLGAEQLFVMQMLQLSSRRIALVEQRAEHAVSSSLRKMNQSSSNEESEAKEAGSEHNSVVRGAVMLRKGEAVPTGVSYIAYHPRAAHSAAHIPPPLLVEVPHRGDDSPKRSVTSKAKETGAEGETEGGGTVPASSSSSTAATFSKDAEPVSPQSPQSPMRRMFEMKGARPVRRPCNHDVITPHRRSDSDSINNNKSNNSISFEGRRHELSLSSISANRGSRANAAKAALQQQAVRRTLSSLETPSSASVTTVLQQKHRRTTATPEGRRGLAEEDDGDGRIEPSADSPTTSTRAERSAFAAGEVVNNDNGDMTFPTAQKSSSKRKKHLSESISSRHAGRSTTSASHNNDRSSSSPAGNVTAPTPLTAITNAISIHQQQQPLQPVDDSSANGDPTSPAIEQTFSAFVQRLCPTSSPLNAAPVTAQNPLSYDNEVSLGPYTTHAASAVATAAVTPVHSYDLDGGTHRWDATGVEYSSPLRDTDSFTMTASYSFASEQLMNTAPSPALQPQLFSPSPPPYTTAPLPRANLGAGTFTTVHQLVAHVRFEQTWTIKASRRWCHENGEGSDQRSNEINNSDNTADLQQKRLLPNLVGCMRSSSNSSQFAAVAAAATMCEPLLLDGEATLVSDRVDAVLPTWAYLASHIADPVPTTLVSSSMRPPLNLVNGWTPSLSSSSTSRHTRHNRSRSFGSSVTSDATAAAAPFGPVDWLDYERLDRQSCIFPYELAEACALGRLRRRSHLLSRHVKVPTVGSLHLLRLECLLDVQRFPPTVRSVSAAERQALFEHALEDFTESGVLPTTVLRSVLNDAALRLLSSVDDRVLQRIAGDETEATNPECQIEQRSNAAGTPSACAEVVPLSLHVHTIQGGLTTTSSATSSPKTTPQPPQSPTTGPAHSGAPSTISGDTDSMWPRSVTAAPATPTQLVITVLVHVTAAPPSAASSAAAADDLQEHTQDASAGEKESPAAASVVGMRKVDNDQPTRTCAPELTEATAFDIAQVVVPHLFPPSFALSRYATRLSLSTAMDDDALGCLPEGETTVTAGAAVAGKGKTVTEQREQLPVATGAPNPWTWVDVNLTELRAACGVVGTKSSRFGGVHDTSGCGELDSLAPSTMPHRKSHTRRSKKTAAAAPSVAAATAEPAPAEKDPYQEQLEEFPVQEEEDRELPQNTKDARAATKEAEGESMDAAGVGEAQLRWNVTTETAELTARAEAMWHHLQRICGHAQQLSQFAKCLAEARGEEQQSNTRGQKTRKGQAKEATRQRAVTQTSYAEEMHERTKALIAHATLFLTNKTLQEAPAHSKSGGSVTNDELEHRISAIALQNVASNWFKPFAERLTVEVCSPLEELELCILESTSSSAATSTATATITSTSVSDEATNCSVNDGTAFTAARRVVGAQVVIKKARRQRRSAATAAAARQPQTADGTEKEDEADMRVLTGGDGVTATLSLVPALTLARAMVQLCHQMTDQANATAPPATVHIAESGSKEGAARVSKGTVHTEASPAPFTSLSPFFAKTHNAHFPSLPLPSSPISVRLLGGSCVARALREHITRAHHALCRMEGQLEAAQCRWAVFQATLPLLQAEWNAAQDIVNKEATARQQLHLACATDRAAMEYQAENRLKEERSTMAAAAVASQAKKKPEEMVVSNGTVLPLNISVSDEPAPPMQNEKTDMGVRVKGSDTTDRNNRGGNDAAVGNSTAASAAMVQQEEKMTEAVTPPLPPRTLSIAAPSPELHSNARGEAQEKEEIKEDTQEEKAEALISGSTRSTTPAAESASEAVWAKRAVDSPLLSFNAADTPRRASHQEGQSTANNNSKGSSELTPAPSSTTLNNTRKLRNRGKQQQQQSAARSNTVHMSASGSPMMNASASGSTFIFSFPIASASSADGGENTPTNTVAGIIAAGSGDVVGGNAPQLVRRAPQDALRGPIPLHVDVTILLQAAPFMVVGTLLLLVFILL